MAVSNFDEFMREYDKDECQNTRCLNRLDTLVERGRELREERALVKRILDHVKANLSADLAFPIMEMIAKHNLDNGYGKEKRPPAKPASPFIE